MHSPGEFHHVSLLPPLIAVAFFTAPALADSDADTCYINIDPHPCVAADDPVKACKKALEDDPYDMQTRLSLCGVHLRDEGNEENKIDAYIVIKKGIELCGSDAYICQRYRYAKSMIEESEEGGRRQQAITARERCDYGRDLCLSRLTSRLGVRGCDLALICDADDPLLHVSKADKLLARDRPAEAVSALRTAAGLDPGDVDINAQLAEAEQARAKLATGCIQGGSLADCNNALLAGESDEFDVQYRRGQLLLAEGRTPAALQAMINAQNRRPADEDLAREMLGLLNPAISESPDDADYRRAQGFALLALGSSDESIMAFRKAQALSPDDGEIARGLATARADRSQRVDRDCLSRTKLKACDDIIMAGEPDEARIREHKARVLRDRNNLDAALAEAKKAARLEPGNAAVAALVTDIQQRQAPPEPEPEPTKVIVAADPAPTPVETPVEPVETTPAPVIFSNAAREDGRTY